MTRRSSVITSRLPLFRALCFGMGLLAILSSTERLTTQWLTRSLFAILFWFTVHAPMPQAGIKSSLCRSRKDLTSRPCIFHSPRWLRMQRQ
jgi:hypothetical protein